MITDDEPIIKLAKRVLELAELVEKHSELIRALQERQRVYGEMLEEHGQH